MRLVTALPYAARAVDWPADAAGPAYTLVVKGSFALAPGGPLAALPADRQQPIGDDIIYLDDIGRSLRSASDLAPFKPRGEVTVRADAHAPGGAFVPWLDVGIAVGPVSKTLRVHGDRIWVAAADGGMRIEGPAPFTTMPLRWERAFGGLSLDTNPMGRGLEPWPEPDGREVFYLPNIEDPRSLVATPADRPEPAGFAPIAQNWAPRRARAGTRDERWEMFRAPLPPLDFDPRHFNAAPADQWIDGFWNGDEQITLFNLHPEHSTLVATLPGRRVRAFLHARRDGAQGGHDESFEEIPLRFDTVHIDAVAGIVELTWRGELRPRPPAGQSVVACYVGEDLLAAQPTSRDAHFAAYLRLSDPGRVAATAQSAAAGNAAPPPPPDDLASVLDLAAVAAKAKARPAPGGPSTPQDLAKALADARAALANAKADPATLARFDAEPSPLGKLSIAFGALKLMLGDAQKAMQTEPAARRKV